MSWNEPGRARYLVVVPVQGTIQEYSREEGDKDVWYGASGHPNPTVFRSGPTMTSAALVEAIGGAIAGAEMQADPIDPGPCHSRASD
jgi:hypothetical protein